jgi:hypothetical protein
MKLKHIFQIFLIFSPISIFAQGMLNNGAGIKIKTGTQIKITNSGFTNKTSSTINNSGTITLDGVLDNYGTITGDIVIGGTGTKNARIGTVESLEISNSGTVTVLDNCSISKVLKLSGGELDANSQTVTLKSDVSRTALVDHSGGGFTTGDINVEKYITDGDGHHFITTPVSTATLNELADNFNLNLSNPTTYIYYYDETSSATTAAARWASPASTSDAMPVGRGYSCWFDASQGKTIDISGELNTGTVNIAMTFTNSNPISQNTNGPYSPEGWNFIGNPYASPLDYTLLVNSLPASSPIGHGMYRWDPKSSTYFSYINGISVPSTVNAIVPSMQGFWMRTTAATTLTLNNSMRITDPDVESSIFLKSSNTDPILRLELEGQGKKVETILTFNNSASENFEPEYDAYFLPSDEPDEIIFSSVCDRGNLSINSLASLADSVTIIPLYNEVSTSGTYIISIKEFTNFPGSSYIILEDLELSIFQNLNSGDYSFTGSPNDVNNRFRLTVVPDFNSINNIEEKSPLKIYPSNGTLVLSLPSESKENQILNIYDMLGRTVFSKVLNIGQKEHRINGIELSEHSIYIAEITGESKGIKIKW